ncbi:MAG: TetR/AcrR family transcriptional regulator [Actinomycetaceae bacterium]|nr:TetR/AcrR family transcriptional regulator [Actinomycetaceae bacterium]
MPRLTEESRERRRRRIAEAALVCFGRKGFSATSMGDIISESGMSSGSIYSHFASKDEILVSVALQTFERANDYFERTVEGDGVDSSPRQICLSLIGDVFPVEYAAWMLGVWAEAAVRDDLRQIVVQALVRARGLLATTIEPWARARGEEDRIDFYVDWIAAIMQSAVVRSAIEPGVSVREIAAELARALPE